MKEYRSGFVGLMGFPNAGKSLLMNALIGEKVSIVTQKPQTTRNRVLGIHSDDDRQIVFVDAPGYIRASKGLNKFLEAEFNSVAEESDALLCCLNIDEQNPEKIEQMIEMMPTLGKPWTVVITKRDLGKPHRVGIIQAKLKDYNKEAIVVSALEDPDQTQKDILDAVTSLLPQSPGPMYSSELYTTQSVRDITRELIRENCFEHLQYEVPYGLAIQIKKYEEKNGLDRIFADVIVSNKRHVPIVLGKNGQQIKVIGQGARESLEKMLGKKIYLDLHVSVKEDWMNKKVYMEDFGYVHEK
ncbi:MAG: GTPase Era [Bdellovibrionales bacterium]|nr:GTPase Era [Bdellovibrionales bacterium]